MKLSLPLLSAVCGFVIHAGYAQGLPNLVIQKLDVVDQQDTPIYRDEGFGIYHKDLGKDESFDRHYVISMPGGKVSPKQLARFGQVIGVAPMLSP